MPSEPKRRGPGRPRTKPADAKERKWWATDAEYKRLTLEAGTAGVSVQELVRRRALGLAERVARDAG